MINESDKSLFRSTVDQQKPIDKDGVKKTATSKNGSNKLFQKYSFLYEPNISGSEAVVHYKSGLSPKVLKKMKQGNIGSTPSIDLHANHFLSLSIFIQTNALFMLFMEKVITQIVASQL